MKTIRGKDFFILNDPSISPRNKNCISNTYHIVKANFFFFFFLINLFIYLFLAALGLRCCARAFSSCGKRGLLFIAVRGLLIAVAYLVVEHRP